MCGLNRITLYRRIMSLPEARGYRIKRPVLAYCCFFLIHCVVGSPKPLKQYRLLSLLLPKEFMVRPNWKTTYT